MPRRRSRSWRRRSRLAPGSVKALFNLAVAYGASPDARAAKEIEHLEKVIALAPDFPRAHLALGKALLQEGKAADAVAALQNAVKLEPDERRGELPAGAGAGAGGPQGGSRGAAEEGTRARRRRRSRPERAARHRRRAGRAATGRARRGGLEDSGAPASCQPESAEPRVCSARRSSSREQLEQLRPRQDRSSGGRSRRGSGVSDADDRARVAELEGYIRDAKWVEVEPLLDDIRRGAAEVLLGLVRPRLHLFRAEEDRRVDQGARQVAAARSEERRSAQDPRPQPDDHRPVRRRAGRVRAGASATSRTPPRATTISASSSPSRTTGSPRARRSRPPCESIPRTSKPSMVSASPWKRSATMPAPSRGTRRRSR